MMYCKVDSGVATEYTYNQLKADNPNVSFPRVPTDELLASYSMHPVIEAPEPAYDNTYQTTTYTIEGSGTTWTQTWAVVGTGISDDDLRAIRYDENYAYAQTVIEAAEASPSTGVALSASEKRKKDAREKARGKSNNPVKVPDDVDYLLDYIDTVYDALDNADDAVEAGDRAFIEAWVPTDATWPVWTPYSP